MKTDALFADKTVFSLEVFPPKRTDPSDSILTTVERLKELSPDFISVTYGAGGSENSDITFSIVSEIKNTYGIESVMHLPCIGLKKEDVLNCLAKLRAAGIENILALRGDIPAGGAPAGDFRYAADLVEFIRAHGDFNIVAACYPEGHVESPSITEDIRNLKRKVDAGVNQLVTQLFFDNEYFYRFIERCRIAGIEVPVEAGIMPVVNKKQIERIVSLCGATLPRKFTAMMARYEDNPEALRDAGIAYAVDQIVDLVTNGVQGIHLYTMNRPYVAERIYSSIKNIL